MDRGLPPRERAARLRLRDRTDRPRPAGQRCKSDPPHPRAAIEKPASPPPLNLPIWFYQFLPTAALRDHLAESLWYLHAQPPLLDLLLGLALKLERASGIPATASLFLVQAALGATSVWALARLLRGLGVRGWRRGVVLGLLLANPVFYHFVLLFFQPIYELAFLLLAALALRRYLDRPSPWRLAAFGSPLLALAYTRSLFHPLWILLAMTAAIVASSGGVVVASSAAGNRGLRRSWLVFGAFVALLLAWPAKNAMLFGSFSFSSWQGFNLSRDLGVTDPPELRVFTAWHVTEADGRVAALVPPDLRGIPALAELRKDGGAPNWNHYAMLALSRQLESEAWEAMRSDPAVVARKSLRNYDRRFVLYPGRHPHTRALVVDGKGEWMTLWMRIYEAVVLQTPLAPIGNVAGETTLLPATPVAFVLPVLLAWIAWRIVQRRRGEPRATAVATFLLTAVLWVLLLCLLVDGGEGNRMRFSTEPLLWTAAAWASRRRAEAAEPIVP